MLAEMDNFRLAAVVAAGLVVFLWIVRRLGRWGRSRRPVRLNPKLAKYGDQGDVTRARQAEAAKIVATSSTGTIAGYELVEQIEAVLVDGFRRPEEALEGLKAAAAMKGANAVVNVRSERTPTGRCTASGDAVVVKRIRADGSEDVES